MTKWKIYPEPLIASLKQRTCEVREYSPNPLVERCPEAKCYEAYDWCNLSDNICIRNTGNKDFDVACEYYNEFLEEVNNG